MQVSRINTDQGIKKSQLFTKNKTKPLRNWIHVLIQTISLINSKLSSLLKVGKWSWRLRPSSERYNMPRKVSINKAKLIFGLEEEVTISGK